MTKLTKIFESTNSAPQYNLVTNDNKTIYEDEKDAVKETRADTTETEVIKQWLVNRCKQNPFELFANATLQLFEELEE